MISAAPGGPASRAGILPGDVIPTIDDTSTETMSIYDATEHLQWVFLCFFSLIVDELSTMPIFMK